MAITYVQGNTHANGSTSSTTIAVTLSAAVGAGNMLCVSVAWFDNGTTTDTITISDDKSNTYTIVDKARSPSPQNFSFSTAFNVGIANNPLTITATISSARTFATILVDEYAGVAMASAIDGHAMAVPALSTTTDAQSSGNITTTVNADLIYGSCVNCNGNGGVLLGTGFTQRLSITNAYMTEARIQSTAGTIAATFSTNDAGDHYVVAVMAFKAGAGPAIGQIQQIGHPAGAGVVAEVEASHLARSVLRSNDYDHGAYSIGFGGGNGGFGTVTTNNTVIAGLQWISTRNFALIKKMTGVVSCILTANAAGTFRLCVYRASSYTQQFDMYTNTGAAAASITSAVLGSGNKNRSTMLNSDASGLRMSSTFAGTAGNAGSPGGSLVYAGAGTVAAWPAIAGGQYTLDALPLTAIVTSGPVAAPTNFRQAPWQVLFDSEIGPPLILENYTGLIFTADLAPNGVSSGGVFSYAINIQWDEVFNYPLGANS